MTNAMELKVLQFLLSGGIICSGPTSAPPFIVGGRWTPVIRQDFLSLDGERIEGLGSAAFKWAKNQDLLEVVCRFIVPVNPAFRGCGPIAAKSSWYRFRRDLWQFSYKDFSSSRSASAPS